MSENIDIEKKLMETFQNLDTDTEKLNDFKNLMENMYLKGLREMPTFSEEIHKKIEEEYQKMYKDAEKYFKKMLGIQ